MRGFFVLLVCVAAISFAASASARTEHYQVTVSVTGPGHVTAPAPDSTSTSIDCPDQCSALMKQNTTVTFTATPDTGATFGGWGGDCASTGTSSTCSVSMTGGGSNGSKSITAGFGSPPAKAVKLVLSVKKIGTGTGFVGGGGIDCGNVCSKRLVRGTKVTLLAVPTGRAVFLGWGAPCSGTGRCALKVLAAAVLTATFADPRRPYVLTLPGSAVRGKITALSFRIWDRNGRSREQLTVAHGGTKLAAFRVPMLAAKYSRVYAFRWFVPRSAPPGIAAFCAVGFDRAGKKSPVSCSRIRIS
jgi:hypothetical protein